MSIRKIKTLFFLFFIIRLTSAQQPSLKEQSIEQFNKENYPLAIKLMEKALANNPKDAEIYYYLGFFNHYNAYDSRPLKGYDSTYSQKVLGFLDKALELNPNYGDAKYLYLTECGATARNEYRIGNPSNVSYYFDKAWNKGVIPKWAIELGKNMLGSCDKNAILFTQGDFQLNICSFVQLHFGIRKDISVVPLSFLGRPSYVLALDDNVYSDILRGVKIGLTQEQILDMHPYKWETLTVRLAVPTTLQRQYSLPNNYKMDWVIEPDLISSQTALKTEGEKVHKRTYLSPERAMLLNIIETNNWERPIYFTSASEEFSLAGLKDYLQNCGLVSKLVPIKTANTQWNINVSALEDLVFKTKLEKLKTVVDEDQPRASGMIGLYAYSYYWLADYYRTIGEKDKISVVIDKYKQNLMIGFRPEVEKNMLDALEKMKN